MQNIKLFLQRFGQNTLIEEQLSFALDSREHPFYHPEGTLIKHIDICVGNAFALNDTTLIFAAMLHDITKSGFCTVLWEGRKGIEKECQGQTYWQNIHHPEQSFDFCHIIKDYIPSDIFNDVSLICLNHMKMKNFLSGEKGEANGMGLSKRNTFQNSLDAALFDKLRTFSTKVDNMLLGK